MREIRKVLRISGSYYICVPKQIVEQLGLRSGGQVKVMLEGRRIVVEKA